MTIVLRSLLFILACFLAYGISLLSLAAHHYLPLSVVVEDVFARGNKEIQFDALAPLYKQSSQNTCGAAAISYLLTRLGDTVFEQHVIESIPEPSTSGYSFDDLARFVKMRGFRAEGVESSSDQLPSLGQTPVLAHLSRGHFVVVHSRTDRWVTLFDPAFGDILRVPEARFSKEWSGRILYVYPLEY